MADLAALDEDEVTASTRIEVERLDTVEDIVKTYLIGTGVDESLLEPPPEFAVEDHVSEPEPIPIQIKAYVDQLEEEEEQRLEPKDVNIITEGQNFEGITVIGIPTRAFSDTESVDSIAVHRLKSRCPEVDAMCVLQRKEDRSSNEVLIAQARLAELALILRRERYIQRQKLQKAAYGMEKEGQEFQDKTIMRTTKRYESEEDEEPKILSVRKLSPAESDRSSIVIEYEEPPTASYEFEQAGRHYDGASMLRRKQQRISDASVEDIKAAARRRGGITHVTAIKKEDTGFFELVISIPNKEFMQRRAEEVPEQQYENLNYFKAIDRTSGSTSEKVEKSMSASNIFKSAINLQEFSTENLSQLVHMERREYLDRDSEADRSIRERRTASVSRDLVQYSVSTENCSVLLENRGALQERTQREWAIEQRGRHSSSSNYAVVRSVSLSSLTTDSHKHQQQSSLTAGEKVNVVCINSKVSSSVRSSTSCVTNPPSAQKAEGGAWLAVEAPSSESFAHSHTISPPPPESIEAQKSALSARQIEQVSINEHLSEQQTSRSYFIPNLRTLLPPHASTQSSFFWDGLQQTTTSRSISLPPPWIRQIPVSVIPSTTSEDTRSTTTITPSIDRLDEDSLVTQSMFTDLINMRRQGSTHGTEVVLIEVPDRNGRVFGVELNLRSSSLPPLTQNSFRPIGDAMLGRIKRRIETVETTSESMNTDISWNSSVASSETIQEHFFSGVGGIPEVIKDIHPIIFSADTSTSTSVSAPPVLYPSESSDRLFRHSETLSSSQESGEGGEVKETLASKEDDHLSVECGGKIQQNLPFDLMSPIPELSDAEDRNSSGDEFFRTPRESSISTAINLSGAANDVSATSIEYPTNESVEIRESAEDTTFEGRDIKTEEEEIGLTTQTKQQELIIKSLLGLEHPNEAKASCSSSKDVEVGLETSKQTEDEISRRTALGNFIKLATPTKEESLEKHFVSSPAVERAFVGKASSSDTIEKKCYEPEDKSINYFHVIEMIDGDEKLATSVIQRAKLEEKMNIQRPSVVNADHLFAPKTSEEFVQSIERLMRKEEAAQTFIISTTHLEEVLKRIEETEQKEKMWAVRLKQKIALDLKTYGDVNAITAIELRKLTKQIGDQSADINVAADVLTIVERSSILAPELRNTESGINLEAREESLVKEVKVDVKDRDVAELHSRAVENTNLTGSFEQQRNPQIQISITKMNSNTQSNAIKTPEAGREIVNYFGDIKIEDKNEVTSSNILKPVHMEGGGLSSKASTIEDTVTNQLLASQTVEEFVCVIAAINALAEKEDKKFVISNVQLDKTLRRIEENRAESSRTCVDKLKEAIDRNTVEYGQKDSFIVVDLQKLAKETTKETDGILGISSCLQRQLDSSAPTHKTEDYPVELESKHSNLSTDIKLDDRPSSNAVLNSKTPSTIQLDKQVSIVAPVDVTQVTQVDVTPVESIRKDVQPPGNEVSNYSLEVKMYPRDEEFGRTLPQTSQRIIGSLKDSRISVDEEIDARTIEEFVQSIERLVRREEAAQTFVISTVRLDAILQNLQG